MRDLLLLFALSLVLPLWCFGQTPVKKNSRPEADPAKTAVELVNAEAPVYFYEFENKKFYVSNVSIEHDDNGLGKIQFQKNDSDEKITEPLQLSSATLERLKASWKAVDFLNSTEKYQSEIRDYAHLGTVRLTEKRDQRERTEEFNWTENAAVKMIADEYRKIGNQWIWLFDFGVARENQPLRTPQLMKGLDSSLRRNAISDPVQILPFLKDLSDDERVPLIARNHAARLVKRIEEQQKKESVSANKP